MNTPPIQHFHIHLISDSTGETVSSVARAAVTQFDNVEAEEHTWSLIRTPAQLDKVLAIIDDKPGIVIYTLVDKQMRDQVKRYCHKNNLPCIPILARVISELAAYLGIEMSHQPGRQYELTKHYYSRIEAINYTLAHDDGQATWELEEADIVIVGPSRTSKSPTCVYLAHRGFKAANVPYVAGCPLPDNLFTLQQPLVVGLTISPDRLVQIRHMRLESLNKDEEETSYTDHDDVMKELVESRRLYQRQQWPTIDVTRRSVEETSANIIQLYSMHREKRKHARP